MKTILVIYEMAQLGK